MTTVQIEPFSLAAFDETATALGRAFERDTFMPSLLPPDHRPARLRAIFEAELRRTVGAPHAIDLARDADGRVVGVAMWVTPGSPGHSTLSNVRALPPLLRALGPRLRSTFRVFDAIERARPTMPHWYLSTLGVVPEHAGTGVGSALLRHGLARVDARREPAYLEGATSGHIGYYERFGFQALGLVDVAHPAPPVRMWREVV